MAFRNSDYTIVIAYHAVTQLYNFGAEIHLGGGFLVFPLAAVSDSIDATEHGPHVTYALIGTSCNMMSCNI